MFNSFPQPKPDGGGSNIKSKQTVSTSWRTTTTTLDITIAEVNPDIAAVDISFYSDFNNSNVGAISAILLNSTTVRLIRNSGLDLGAFAIIFITVYEYNNVKSKQTGTTGGNNATELVVTVSKYNSKKALLLVSATSAQTSSNGYDSFHMASRTINDTSIGFTGQTPVTAYYQLLEFN